MNTLAAIVEIIKATPKVTVVVGARVYGNRIPKGYTLPAVVVRRIGGTMDADTDNEIQEPTADIRVYGNTPLEASDASAAICEALNGARGVQSTNYLLHEARMLYGPYDLEDDLSESTTLDCVMSTWSFEISEV